MKPDSARVWFEGLVTGFLGYFTIVLFYGLLNLLIGRSFFHTAALLGRSLVEAGPDGGIPDPAGAILAFNGLHLLAGTAMAFYLLKAHPRLWVELRDHLDPETEQPTPD